MAPFNYPAMRSVADKLIQQFGMRASLVRGGVYRDCWVVITDYNPKDAESQLRIPRNVRSLSLRALAASLRCPPIRIKATSWSLIFSRFRRVRRGRH